MSNDKMRETFENWVKSSAWCKFSGFSLDTDEGIYADADTEAMWQAVSGVSALTQQPESEPLRFTGDGELAECPCCGSLDVGAVGGSCSIQMGVSYVNCYGCGLELKRKGTMKEACAAWNKRTTRSSQPTPQVPEPVRFTNEDAGRVAQAFWRRIHSYVYAENEYQYPKEFGSKLPVEFQANMATALLALPNSSVAPSVAEKDHG